MKTNYGMPYLGSKNKIAEDIIDFLPSGNRLVDLFGGGEVIGIRRNFYDTKRKNVEERQSVV